MCACKCPSSEEWQFDPTLQTQKYSAFFDSKPTQSVDSPETFLARGVVYQTAHSVRFSQIDLPRPSEEAFLVAQKLPLQKLGSQE